MCAALRTNALGQELATKLQRQIRPDAFMSTASQAQSGFDTTIRNLLISRGVFVDHPGVA